MNLKNIDIHILKILMCNKKITLKEIINIYDERELNIRNSLIRIDEFLKEYNLGAIVKENKEFTLLINTKTEPKLIKNNLNFSSEERLNYLLLTLVFNKKLNAVEIAEFFQINRNTVISDINSLKEFIKKYNLNLNSVAWKGLYLEGKHSDIYNFSISVILKFLIEEDLNSFTYLLYGNFVNPTVEMLFHEKLSLEKEKELKEISKKLINIFEIKTDTYGYNALTSIFIYLYIMRDENINIVLEINDIYLEGIYEKIIDKLDKSDILINYDFLSKNIKLIGLGLLNITKEYLYYKLNLEESLILKDIESMFNIKFDMRNKVEFINILHTLEYKYNFKIYNFTKIPKNKLKIPSILFKILKTLLDKYEYKILKKDVYVLVQFLYEVLYFSKIDEIKNKKILIIDYSSNNWRGEHLKDRLISTYNMKNLSVKSLYSLSLENEIEKSDYIFVAFDTDHYSIEKTIEKNKRKFIFLEYIDFFEVSYLINKILIGDYIGTVE